MFARAYLSRFLPGSLHLRTAWSCCVLTHASQVISNGNIRFHSDLGHCLAETGCAGVMSGCGALRRPTLFAPNGPGHRLTGAVLALEVERNAVGNDRESENSANLDETRDDEKGDLPRVQAALQYIPLAGTPRTTELAFSGNRREPGTSLPISSRTFLKVCLDGRALRGTPARCRQAPHSDAARSCCQRRNRRRGEFAQRVCSTAGIVLMPYPCPQHMVGLVHELARSTRGNCTSQELGALAAAAEKVEFPTRCRVLRDLRTNSEPGSRFGKSP